MKQQRKELKPRKKHDNRSIQDMALLVHFRKYTTIIADLLFYKQHVIC